MKRFLSLLIALLCAVSVFASCESNNYDTPPEEFLNPPESDEKNEEDPKAATEFDIPSIEGIEYDYFDFSRFITLPDYKSNSFIYSRLPIDDVGIANDIEYLKVFSPSARLTETDEASGKGDLVTFDYKATNESGEVVISGSDIPVIIGRDMFAPGFDGYIIGAMKGQSLTFNFTFPEGWTNISGVQGMTLSFSVTVDLVQEMKLPDLDTILREQDAESEEALRLMIVENRESTNSSNLFDSILRQSEVKKYPEKELQAYRALFQKNDEVRAQAYGTTLDGIIATDYNGSKVEYEKAKTEFAEEKCKRDLVICSLKEIYSFELTKEEYNLALEDYFEENASSMGFKTIEEAHENMGTALATSLYNDIAARAAYNDIK